ncbi:MAG: hypothetical protein MHPSP_001458, partial [Paramarteilia canceri]
MALVKEIESRQRLDDFRNRHNKKLNCTDRKVETKVLNTPLFQHPLKCSNPLVAKYPKKEFQQQPLPIQPRYVWNKQQCPACNHLLFRKVVINPPVVQ